MSRAIPLFLLCITTLTTVRFCSIVRLELERSTMIEELAQLIIAYMKHYGLAAEEAAAEIRLDLPEALTFVRDKLS